MLVRLRRMRASLRYKPLPNLIAYHSKWVCRLSLTSVTLSEAKGLGHGVVSSTFAERLVPHPRYFVATLLSMTHC